MGSYMFPVLSTCTVSVGVGLRPAAAGFRKIRGRLAPQTPIRLGGGLVGVGFAVFRDAENKPAMRP